MIQESESPSSGTWGDREKKKERGRERVTVNPIKKIDIVSIRTILVEFDLIIVVVVFVLAFPVTWSEHKTKY